MADFFKHPRRFYQHKKRDGTVTFTYVNWSYSRNSVPLVKYLRGKIANDCPGLEDSEIFFTQKSTFPHEIALQFSRYRWNVDMDNLEWNYEPLPEEIPTIKMERMFSSKPGKVVRGYNCSSDDESVNIYYWLEREKSTSLAMYKRLMKRIRREHPRVKEDNIFIDIVDGVVTLSFSMYKSDCDMKKVHHNYRRVYID